MRRLLTRPWTDDDDHILREAVAQRMPVRRIAHKLYRSQSAIRGRMNVLGLRALPGTPTLFDLRRVMRDDESSHAR
jgi:hypothetical protein